MTNNADKIKSIEEHSKVRKDILRKGKHITFLTHSVPYPDGSEKQFDIAEHPGAVTMIAANQNGEIYLVKQWRRAPYQVMWELPAGTLEKGELPQVCAGRELQEEIGMSAENLHPITDLFSAPGFSTEKVHFFIATGLVNAPLQGEDTHEIDVETFSLSTIESMIADKTIIDMKTIAGIYLYKAWLKEA